MSKKDVKSALQPGETAQSAEQKGQQARRRDETNWIITGSLSIIAVVALGAALIYTRVVMIPFVMAIFVFALISPMLDFQILRLRLPRFLAVIITLLIVIGITSVLGVILARSVQTIVETATRYSEEFVNLTKQVLASLERWGLKVHGSELTQEIQKGIPRFVRNTTGSVFGFVSNITFISIFLMFLLSGRDPRVIHKGVYADIENQIRRYIATKLVVSTATGVFVWLLLALFKLQLAAVFGMLAFLLNFIPSIGSILATLLPIPIAVAQYEHPWMAVLVIGLVGTVEMIIGNGIEPKMMGKGLNLHPVVILLALSFWGLLWGIWGMFLAVPMTATVRAVLMQFDRYKPIGRLLAGQVPHERMAK